MGTSQSALIIQKPSQSGPRSHGEDGAGCGNHRVAIGNSTAAERELNEYIRVNCDLTISITKSSRRCASDQSPMEISRTCCFSLAKEVSGSAKSGEEGARTTS